VSGAPLTKAMLAPAGAALAVAAVLAIAVAHADDAGIFNAAPFTTTDGQQIYQQICQGCHMPDARGAAGAGHYPALASNATLASRQYTALTVLAGRRNMPGFGVRHAIGFVNPPLTLTGEQIAEVVNYVRTHFGNHYTDPTTAAEVQALDRTLH
jgi:mono/diheme cytochrome c family protein